MSDTKLSEAQRRVLVSFGQHRNYISLRGEGLSGASIEALLRRQMIDCIVPLTLAGRAALAPEQEGR